jgi:hypothetical protein
MVDHYTKNFLIQSVLSFENNREMFASWREDGCSEQKDML